MNLYLYLNLYMALSLYSQSKLIVIFTFKSISSFWKKLTSRPDKFKTSFIGVWW